MLGRVDFFDPDWSLRQNPESFTKYNRRLLMLAFEGAMLVPRKVVFIWGRTTKKTNMELCTIICQCPLKS